jgi:hypothetical protein
MGRGCDSCSLSNLPETIIVHSPCRFRFSTMVGSTEGRTSMGSSTSRSAAVIAATNSTAVAATGDYKNETAEAVFGVNVFGLGVMKTHLPKDAYTSTRRSPTSSPSAMKDWAIENGASHYAHVFYPLTGLTAEKHDSFLEPDGAGASIRVRRQDAHPGRARRVELPNGGIRGTFEARGYTGVGRHQPRLHPREPERQHAVHPHRVHLVDRRSARQEDPVLRSSRRSTAGPARAQAVRHTESTPSCRTPAPSRSTS